MIIEAADILPQFIYAQEDKLTDATGNVLADTGVRTREKMKSFQEKIKQKTAVVAIPLASTGTTI